MKSPHCTPLDGSGEFRFLSGPLGKLANNAKQRIGWLCLFIVCALAGRWSAAAPPEATQAGIASMLAAAAGEDVAADGFVWEASRGALLDVMWGRDVLFLAGAPRDFVPRDRSCQP